MALLIVFLLGSISFSFLCSILESALMSTPLSYVLIKEEEGYRYASLFKQYKQESARPIAAILSLNTIANTIGAAGVGRQATLLFGSQWFGLVSALTTILILVFSEIIPKTIGSTKWRHLMGFTTVALRAVIFITYPVVIVLEKLSSLISKDNEESVISREEVSALMNAAEEDEEIDEDENAMIQNIIKMDDIPVYEAMTPRVVAAVAPESMTVRSYYKDKKFKPYSRIPVYSESSEYITGYILRTDALQLLADDKFDSTLGSIKRPIELFKEDTMLGEVWDKMLANKEQISCVIDDYGAFQGILSMEDVIETIIGSEIVDENDVATDMQELARQRWRSQIRKNGNK